MFKSFVSSLNTLKTNIASRFTVECAEHNNTSHACAVCKDTGKDRVHSSLNAPAVKIVDVVSAQTPAADGNTTTEGPAADEVACLAYMHSGCPLNRRELGRASWAYLHTLAAYYPDKPTEKEKEDMKTFVRMYARMYPCGYCADKTRDEMWKNPPRLENQKEFSIWMCEIHNEVNDRMGKPVFDCSKVGERWKHGFPECHQ